MSSSDAWYWGWSSTTSAVTSALMARIPHDGSVTFWRTNTVMSPAKSTTPRLRTASLLVVEPSRRDPETKSASLLTSGASTRSMSSLWYWPSASLVRTKRAPRWRASRYPRRKAAPWPRLRGTSQTRAAASEAICAVLSDDPSTTTMTSVPRPHSSAGTAATTVATVASSL